jgi:hypothetical protein
MRTSIGLIALLCAGFSGLAMAEEPVYSGFPVTVKGYSGQQDDSTSYSGQIARHVLHSSLKKLAGQGDGSEETGDSLKPRMMAYFSGKPAGREILDPVTDGQFVIAQTGVDEVSGGKNLADKVYGGAVTGWPGAMTGVEVLEFMIAKAAYADGGFDVLTGYDYPQLISKFLMGAVFYNQAVAHYLEEGLKADVKPNDKPYSEGAAYTGKEHVWDEAFGYFGAPAHALTLSAAQAYGIAKTDPSFMDAADHDGDGRVDLTREMTFAHAYYAADADKSGKTEYLHTITQAFLDGRKLIAGAGGEPLTPAQLQQLRSYADIISSNWEKLIAEAAFKYAGSVYEDLNKIDIIVDANGDPRGAFREYAEHWGELKGFSLALQAGAGNLGETAVKLNRLIGYGPVLLGGGSGGRVVGIDENGEYEMGDAPSMGDYMVDMIKVQRLLADRFNLAVRKNDATARLQDVMESVDESQSAETD